MEACQLWVGNIPSGLSEADALMQLRAYGIIPQKLVLRQRGTGFDGYGIMTFASPQLAAQAMSMQCWWSSGKHMLMRLLLSSSSVVVLHDHTP